jgi:glycosyltransferase involved in cell wall biosynthesis
MAVLPKLSIITPTLNQAQFIAATVESVLTQQYPDLEYIVLDGGSTDGTADIMAGYAGRLTFVSEPDRGQVDAINKGLRRCSGEVVAYLNSDDVYLPGALRRVGAFFADHPQARALTGKCRRINEAGKTVDRFVTAYKNAWLLTTSRRTLLIQNYISQPSTFWRRDVLEEVGGFNDAYHYAFDYEYWLRITAVTRMVYVNAWLSAFRVHGGSITGATADRHLVEETVIARQWATRGEFALLAALTRLSGWIFWVGYGRGGK